MEQKTIKALFVNGGPRKNKNTAQMLESAMQGAKDAGAEVELVHLYDLDYKGCKSCFACQLKNAKTDGVCAIRDGLRPVLEKAREADVIVIGSPVYFSYPTGQTRSFLERLIFPNFTYDYDEQGNRRRPIRKKQTAMIFTMNCPLGAVVIRASPQKPFNSLLPLVFGVKPIDFPLFSLSVKAAVPLTSVFIVARMRL